ncbi:MAG: hypothetical protein ACE14M_07795 [Terriglobales bacterium]
MSDTETRSILRRIDLLAVVGFTGLAVGAALFKFGADYVPSWLAWLVAPLLWYAGVGMLVGWACGRMFSMGRRRATVSDPDAPKPRSRFVSNFVEHDFEFDKAKETA